MAKLLIAGPTKVDNAFQADRLKGLVWHYLNRITLENALSGSRRLSFSVVCADDTATGRYAKMWSQTLLMPVFPYSARLDKEIYSQNDRDLIHIRDMKMIAEPEIVKAILLNHTNECSHIMSELRKNNQIEIVRVMG